MVALWGCSEETEKAKTAVKSLLTAPMKVEVIKACRLLVENATADEANKILTEVVNDMLRKGEIPNALREDVSASKIDSPEQKKFLDEAAMEMYGNCQKLTQEKIDV